MRQEGPLDMKLTTSSHRMPHGSSLLNLLLLLLLCLSENQPSEGIKWLGLASERRQLTWNSTRDCSRSRAVGLARGQRIICQQNIELMPLVQQASRVTFDGCQELFFDRRWNCSSIQMAPKYLPDLTGNSREQAFVQSLSSAALVQSIAKACSTGFTAKCGCGPIPTDEPPQADGGQFKWGGCGDDVRFGLVFSKWFTDSHSTRRRRRSKREVLNAHNNAVGRKTVADSLSTNCKCHGVSGSCTVKTCYRALPADIRPEVGAALRTRYAVAVHVGGRRPSERKSGRARGRGRRRKSKTRQSGDNERTEQGADLAPVKRADRLANMLAEKAVKDDDLVYYTISPDYCLPDPALGSIGTKDRECDKDSTGTGGCRSMCCGRGYSTQTVQVRHRCDCKYYWCCYVKCKTCTKMVQVHRCR